MKFIWVDTETTGLDEQIHRPFEIAVIYLNNRKEEDGRISHLECERDFYLNPIKDGIEVTKEALEITGISEDQIKAMEPAEKIVKNFIQFLEDIQTHFKTGKEEKPFLCGYNVSFDYKMIKALLSDYGYNFDDYIQSHLMDVYSQVKAAGDKRVLPYLPNRKLGTIAEYLHVKLDNAHNALADIRATKEVSKSLFNKGVPLK